MKFAHLADTHIRNLRYHRDYRIIFEELFETLRKEQVDCIVHCGDLAHTKTHLSPEYFDLASHFLKSLADIAPTYVILGNHDGNLKSKGRQNAITPLVDTLRHPDLHLLKDAGEVHLDELFCLNVLSIFDRDNWTKPTNKDKVNIALYHGAIKGAKTDLGWKMENGDDDISAFGGFDYALLGDIHKQQTLDSEGRVQYCGSTIQQNHGELDDKGCLIWDIRGKDDWDCKPIVIENPRPFVTLKLTKAGSLPRKKVKAGARIRLVSSTLLTLDKVRKVIDATKVKYKPESVTFVSKADDQKQSAVVSLQEDLRDPAVQEKWIRNFLSEHDLTEEQWSKLLKINRELDSEAQGSAETARNVSWSLKSIEWDNLFNYSEGNCINFEDLSGIVGILGKNFSGKSSVIDSFLFTVFNTTSKNNRKNIDIINQKREEGSGKAEIQVGDNTFVISRSIQKYKKKGNTEARTELDFEMVNGDEIESLNGMTKMETDQKIRQTFGTYADFHTTALSSQMDSMSFLNEGSAKRKEILAKFLDLEIFEKKLKLVKESSVDVRGALRLLNGKNFEQDHKETRTDLAKNEILIENKNAALEETNNQTIEINNDLKAIKEQLAKVPEELVSVNELTDKISAIEQKVNACEEENKEYEEEVKKLREYKTKLDKFLTSLDYKKLEVVKEEGDEILEKIGELDGKILLKEKDLEYLKQHTELLDGVPCGDRFRHCKFIVSTLRSQDKVNAVEVDLNLLRSAKKNMTLRLENIDYEKAKKHIEKYVAVRDKRKEVQNDTTELLNKKYANELECKKAEAELPVLREKLQEMFDKQDLYEKADGFRAEARTLLDALKSLNESAEGLRAEVRSLIKENGSLEEKLKSIEQQQAQFEELQQDHTLYDLLTKSYHSNGIPYQITQSKIPQINEEVGKVLAGIVDFTVFFDADGKKLEIYIQHQGQSPRPIEMGSGAEKTICAMAIRLALLNISTLPKGDIFILDEPGTALDEDNMNGFIQLLTMIKEQFKTVVLISHLNSLKDVVDKQILIEQSDGFAHVDQ